MNFKKKLLLYILLTLFLPINVFAYSSKVVLGGDNIGITVNTKEVTVVGFYKVNGKYIAKDSGFLVGDKIIKVNGTLVTSIEELISEINKSIDDVTITVLRNDVEVDLKLDLIKENDSYKTGLYIKDEITGVGTLTYIDPGTSIYGSLGHEILDNKTGKLINIKDGSIFESIVTGVIKTTSTSTGEKRALFNKDNIKGTIDKNTIKGIFGNNSD